MSPSDHTATAPDEFGLELIDRWWRAANYLSAGQIYLLDNPLLREPLRPELVVEVGYDHVSGGRFRHGTRFLRWRPDKAARQCRMSQLR